VAGQTGLDEEALVRLYERLERPLFNVAYRFVWTAPDAQEVVQETFLRLWRMRERVRIESVEPLLYRIAINLATSRLRRRRLWRWVSLEALRERAAPGPGAEAQAVAAQQQARMRGAIEALPPDLRSVVVLCELGGLSYAQVAEALGIPAGTVGSRRHRALERLQRELSGNRHDG
jgi:RNA polymerase sigma-70 factor (ECF subfamily)